MQEAEDMFYLCKLECLSGLSSSVGYFFFCCYEKKKTFRQSKMEEKGLILPYSYGGILSIMAGKECWCPGGIQEMVITFHSYTEAEQEVGTN